jgi:N-acetylneuraminic acid mutarotase
MPDGRRYALAATTGGLLYVLGGATLFPFAATATVRSYDPATNSWTDRPPMPAARVGFTVGAVAVVSGILYVLGGDGAFDAYDPSTNTWTTRAAMPSPRAGVALAVINGKIYAAGGGSFGGSGGSQAVDVYDPATNAWTSRAPMPTARIGVLFAVTNGRLYAIGGAVSASCGAPSCSSFAVDAYDPQSDSWAARASIPVTNAFVSFVESVNGIIYLGRNSKPGCLAYDPAANAWSFKATMPGQATGPAGQLSMAAGIGGRLYVITTAALLDNSAVFVLTP